MTDEHKGDTPEHYGAILPVLKNIAFEYLRGLETFLRLVGSLFIIGVLSVVAAVFSYVIFILPLKALVIFDAPPTYPILSLTQGSGSPVQVAVILILSPLIIRFGLSATGFSHPSKIKK